MAIQRAAPMPVPPEEAARIRSNLAKEYGAEVWEGPERRVLLIRVPRDDPDPVNDVEAAVEHLQPDDVDDVSHCLLMGEQRVAQVYVRPLQDLMKERLAFDRRQAEHWRQELPGQLSHSLFQAPDDPRRRWRLAIRVPCDSVSEVEEQHFDDLVEGIGPQLETSRFKQIVAVYVIAANDHIRLQGSVFLKEMHDKWVDEERLARKEAEERKAATHHRARLEEDKRRQDDERLALLREVDRKMARFKADKAVGSSVARRNDDLATTEDPAGQARVIEIEPAGGLLAESETTLIAQPSGPRNPRGPWTVTDVEQPEAPANSADALLARAAAESADVSARLIKDVPATNDVVYDTDAAVADLVGVPRGLTDRLDALRARVDTAIDLAPSRLDLPRSSTRRSAVATRTPRSERSARLERAGIGASRMDRESTRRSSTSTTPRRNIDLPRGDTQGRLRFRLEECGFDVISSPAIAGHVIDLAAERPDGKPQRVVCRIVPRLDVPIARQLLKTARELEVDLVLCVAEQVDDEAARILVATKVKLATPQDVTAYRF